MATNRNTAQVTILATDRGTFSIVGNSARGASTSIHHVGVSADFADRELKGVAQSSSNSTKEFSKMSQGIGGLVHTYAIFAANIFAVTAAFTALSQAADYTRMIEGARQLSISTGNDLVGIAKALKDVSAGAIDFSEAMQQTALGTAAGFSGTQLKNLTELATKAGVALGRSVPDAINRLIKAVVKGEPELTDELGIILRLKEATDAYATSVGKATSELTIGERSQAVYVQAMERGLPKYKDVEITGQPYDQLAASIKEVTRDILGFVNKGLNPLIEGLAASKGLILLIIALLGKMLLTKSTDFFSNSFAKRIDNARAKIKGVNKEMKALSSRQASIKNILETEIAQGTTSGVKTPTYEKLGKSITDIPDKDLKNLSRKLRKAINEGASSAKIGKFFTKSMSDEVRKSLPSAIRQAVTKGLKSVSYIDTYGATRKISTESPEALAAMGKSLEKLELQDELLEKMNSKFGKLSLGIEKASVSVAKFKNNMKAAGLTGYDAAIFSGWNKGLTQINGRLQKSNLLVKALGRGIFTIGFGFGKLTRAVDIFGRALGKAFGIFTTLTIAFQAINAIFNFSTDNLSRALTISDEITESLLLASKTAASIKIDVSNLSEYKTELKKVSAIGRTAADNIGKTGEIADAFAASTSFDQVSGLFIKHFKARFKDVLSLDFKSFFDAKSELENEDTTARKLIEANTLMTATLQEYEEGREALKSISEAEVAATYNMGKNYEDVLTTVVSLGQERSKLLADPEGNAGKIAAIDAVLKQLNGVSEKTKSVQIDILEIIGKRAAFSEALKENDEAALNSIFLEVTEVAKLLGIEDSIEQITKQIAENMNAGLITLENTTVAAKTLLDVIKEIDESYGKATGAAKTAADLGGLQAILRKHRKDFKEFEENMDENAKIRAQNEIDMAEERIRYLEEALAIEHELAETTLEASKKSFANFEAKETITRKQLDDREASIERQISKERSITNELSSQHAAAKLAEEGAATAGKVALEAAKAKTAEIFKQLMAQALITAELRRQLSEVLTIDPRKKAKKIPKVKTQKIAGYKAQTELEQYTGEQLTISREILKNDLASAKAKYTAAKKLYGLEVGAHKRRLDVLEANRDDAAATYDKAISVGQLEKAAQAELAYAKATTAIVRERTEEYQKLYELQLQFHEKKKELYKEELPSASEFGKTLVDDLVLAADRIRKEIMDPISMITDAIVSVIDTATKSLADAIVENDYSNIREDLSKNLKSSASGFLQSAFKQGIYSLFGKPKLTGTATDELTALNQQTSLLQDIADNTDTSLLGGGGGLLGNLLGGGGDTGGGATSGIMSSVLSSVLSIFGFAKGGILDHIKTYATGGITRGAELAVIGEGKNNEAVVPLPDNKSIPVKLTGGTGDNKVTTNITINNGEAEVNTDAQGKEAKVLGDMINIAVKRILLDERRSGGILT